MPHRQHLEMLQVLAHRCPLVFSVDMTIVRPLKIGIHADLQAILQGTPFADPDKIQAFLDRYTRLFAYHDAIWKSRYRYNLAGEAVAEIETVHRDRAAVRGMGALRRWDGARRRQEQRLGT